jgi:TetR/AcrR family transcriptional regulator, transcriptional repressor for nem operon
VTTFVATEQGRRTRERLVETAATLMAERGPEGTSLDLVRAAASASKSQLYHYFGDKQGLVHAVTDRQCERVLEFQTGLLSEARDWSGLHDWADAIVAAAESRKFRGGCPVGTLAAALADTDDGARQRLASAFGAWRSEVAGALARLTASGCLSADADLESLTTVTLAMLQGGLLLAKTERSSKPLRIALDGLLACLQAHAPQDS